MVCTCVHHLHSVRFVPQFCASSASEALRAHSPEHIQILLATSEVFFKIKLNYFWILWAKK